MKKFLIAFVLTTLFAFVMPLQAAYSQGTDGTVSAGCITVEQILTPENLAILEKNGGSNVAFKDAEAVRFQTAAEDDLLGGRRAPFRADFVLIITPNPTTPVVNVGWFKDGCMVNSGNLPRAFVEYFQQKA